MAYQTNRFYSDLSASSSWMSLILKILLELYLQGMRGEPKPYALKKNELLLLININNIIIHLLFFNVLKIKNLSVHLKIMPLSPLEMLCLYPVERA